MRRMLPLALALALALGGCAPKPESATGYYFNTVVTLTAYDTTQETVMGALALCGRYEALMSRTVEGSDVWNLNHAHGRWVTVNQDTAAVIKLAVEYGQLSGGRFDVTIAPVSDLWDFAAQTPTLPQEDALTQAAALVDYTKIELVDNQVRLPAGMALDLGAIAKGYIADRVADYLRGAGVASAILNFGGNVVAIGTKPDGSPWAVAVQDPAGAGEVALPPVAVSDGCAVTSGIYERGFTLDGVRYHHILDPNTGWPVQNGLASVTIFCPQSAHGDALSTTLFALGLEEGAALAETLGVGAVFVTTGGDVVEVEAAPTE